MEARRLAAVEDVPRDGTHVFTITRDGSTREVVLSRLDGGDVVAWANRCQHWIDVHLDEGEGAVLLGESGWRVVGRGIDEADGHGSRGRFDSAHRRRARNSERAGSPNGKGLTRRS